MTALERRRTTHQAVPSATVHHLVRPGPSDNTVRIVKTITWGTVALAAVLAVGATAYRDAGHPVSVLDLALVGLLFTGLLVLVASVRR